jgi:branched-chain amino acid transport system ATP-binding protein
MSNILLQLTGVKVCYGGIQAVKGIDLEVRQGELVSLIGSNGAGKTTTLKALSGLQPVAEGQILYAGQSIHQLQAWQRVEQGLIMVPEGRGVFARMSIAENLKMGAYIRQNKTEIATDLDKVFTIFPRLKERRHQLAGTLSGGEQQMLAMGRALMSAPRLLLLDEPSMGLAPMMVDKIFDVIANVRASGLTILLVEQNVKRALGVADRAYVMESGVISLQGAAAELLQNPKVRKAYLGE